MITKATSCPIEVASPAPATPSPAPKSNTKSTSKIILITPPTTVATVGITASPSFRIKEASVAHSVNVGEIIATLLIYETASSKTTGSSAPKKTRSSRGKITKESIIKSEERSASAVATVKYWLAEWELPAPFRFAAITEPPTPASTPGANIIDHIGLMQAMAEEPFAPA